MINGLADVHKSWVVTCFLCTLTFSAETVSIASSSLQQIQSSISLSLCYCNFCISEAVVQRCFFKKIVLKSFAKFVDVSSGTGASCEICDILKSTFFCRTPPVVASGICNNEYFLFYRGAKDFIFTCTFL